MAYYHKLLIVSSPWGLIRTTGYMAVLGPKICQAIRSISLFPGPAEDYVALILSACTAMYEARFLG